MALTRTAYAAANTTEFATALKNALEATDLFDSVTLSEKTVTCTKNSQAILTAALDATSNSDVFVVKNSSGSTLASLSWKGGSSAKAASAASISTDGSFVYIILTNADVNYSTGERQAYFLFIGKTAGGKVGITVAYTESSSASVFYPPTGTMICNEDSFEADTSTAFGLPRSMEHGYFVTYPLTAQKTDGSVDTFDGSYGVLAAPSVFKCTRNIMGVLPPVSEIGNKSYLTDGCIAIDVTATAD